MHLPHEITVLRGIPCGVGGAVSEDCEPNDPHRFGYRETDILCLTEDDALIDHSRLPTRHNIMAGRAGGSCRYTVTMFIIGRNGSAHRPWMRFPTHSKTSFDRRLTGFAASSERCMLRVACCPLYAHAVRCMLRVTCRDLLARQRSGWTARARYAVLLVLWTWRAAA
jgi:hypothetical protein